MAVEGGGGVAMCAHICFLVKGGIVPLSPAGGTALLCPSPQGGGGAAGAGCGRASEPELVWQ